MPSSRNPVQLVVPINVVNISARSISLAPIARIVMAVYFILKLKPWAADADIEEEL